MNGCTEVVYDRALLVVEALQEEQFFHAVRRWKISSWRSRRWRRRNHGVGGVAITALVLFHDVSRLRLVDCECDRDWWHQCRTSSTRKNNGATTSATAARTTTRRRLIQQHHGMAPMSNEWHTQGKPTMLRHQQQQHQQQQGED